MKLLLAPIRSTMSEKRLNNLALMGAHKNRLSNISTEFVMEKFAEKPRHANIGSSAFISNLLSDSDSNDSDQGSFYLLFFSLRTSFNNYYDFFFHELYSNLSFCTLIIRFKLQEILLNQMFDCTLK